MSIHATAIVHPDARLHVSVAVGPYSVIDADVEVGEGTVLGSGVRVHSGVRIGEHNRIDDHAMLGTEPQDLGYDPKSRTGLVIGDHNRLREAVNISRSTKADLPTRIGNHNYLMGNFHVGHDCQIGDRNIFTHGSVLAGFVQVGNRVVISGLVAVHQFCRIGDLAMLSGCSRINKDVPPYMTAEGVPTTLVGLNTVGLKRAGFDLPARLSVKRTYEAIFRGGMGLKRNLDQLRQRETCDQVTAIIQFYEHSKRGVTAHRRDIAFNQTDEDS